VISTRYRPPVKENADHWIVGLAQPLHVNATALFLLNIQATQESIAENRPIVAWPANPSNSGQMLVSHQQQQRITKAIRMKWEYSAVIHGICPEGRPGDLDAMLMNFPQMPKPDEPEDHHHQKQSNSREQTPLE
jgi:hypothetical protein